MKNMQYKNEEFKIKEGNLRSITTKLLYFLYLNLH